MADPIVLQLEPRSLTGSKVKNLRREGIIPANIFGRGIGSVSVQAPLTEWRRVFRTVDRNAVVTAQIAGESGTRPIVLRNAQTHPVTGQVQHIDLYQVDLSRPIHSEAAIVITGESEGVALGGVLIQSLNSVTLQALPMEMPSEIEVDITVLNEIGIGVSVGDLRLPPGVEVLNDPATTIVSVIAPRLAAEEEEAAEAEEGEEAEGEEAEGEEAAEGGAEAEGSAAESSSEE